MLEVTTTTLVQQEMDFTLDSRFSKDVTKGELAKPMMCVQVYADDPSCTINIDANMTKLDTKLISPGVQECFCIRIRGHARDRPQDIF